MKSAQWSDLRERVISGVVLAILGLTSAIIGGNAFGLFVSVICGAMIWELFNLSSKGRVFPLVAALIVGLCLYFLPAGSWGSITILFLVVPISAFIASQNHKVRVFLFAIMISASGLVLDILRNDQGLYWLLWLVMIVIASDVAGYFGGRLMGGPKFWPSLSPKKTWSGTASGWIAAALVGLVFDTANAGLFVALSVLVAFASQMGDIAESALKRKFEIKDSSNLIPGHGGFLDRFDAMIAAALVVGAMSFVLPEGLDLFQLEWR